MSRARSDPISYIFSVPGEIKRRVVELDPQVSPEEIMSREVELDSQVSPEEIMSGEVELACEGWTSFASGVVPQQQCSGHCLCDSAHAPQLKQQLRSALVAGQWRGDTALTLPLFWRRSTVSPVFFGRYPRSSLSLSCPLPPSRSTVSQVFFGRYPRSSFTLSPPPPPPPPPVPNKQPRFRGRKAKWSRSTPSPPQMDRCQV